MKRWVDSIMLMLLVGVLTVGIGCNATSTPTTGSGEESPGVELPADDSIADPLELGSIPEAVEFELLIAIAGSGTVSPPYSGPIDQNTEVTLAVQPSEGWIFDHWEGDVSGDGPLVTLLMDGPKNVIAVFVVEPGPVVPNEPESHVLEVVVIGNGTVLLSPIGSPVLGVVDSSDPTMEIQIGWEYEAGTQIELLATPDDDWSFVEWSGAVQSSASSITIGLGGDLSFTAAFEFLEGDLFSFLSIDDTDLFWFFQDIATSQNQLLLNDALNVTEGVSCAERIDFLNTFLRDMNRASTWETLGVVLGESPPLTLEQLEEVDDWNRTTYPTHEPPCY